MYRLFFSVMVFIAIISCARDLDPIETERTYPNVDSPLWSYFHDFEKEASQYGLDLDLEALGITGEIKAITEDGVAGTCQYGQHIHHVTVDLDFWNNASPNYREYVVFHELGHCVLERGHSEETFTSGQCKSIMASGLGSCFVKYDQETRDQYLEELFQNALLINSHASIL